MLSSEVGEYARLKTQKVPTSEFRVSLAIGLFYDFTLYVKVDQMNYTVNTGIRGSSMCNRPST